MVCKRSKVSRLHRYTYIFNLHAVQMLSNKIPLAHLWIARFACDLTFNFIYSMVKHVLKHEFTPPKSYKRLLSSFNAIMCYLLYIGISIAIHLYGSCDGCTVGSIFFLYLFNLLFANSFCLLGFFAACVHTLNIRESCRISRFCICYTGRWMSMRKSVNTWR